MIGATGCALIVVSVLAVTGSAAPAEVRWRPLLKVSKIVDVVGPRADGQLVLSTRRGLLLAPPGRPATEFARGPAGYVAAGGEPYIALARARRLPNAGCAFKRDDVFALDADSTPGLVRIRRTGHAERLVDFPAGAFPSGIAFDFVGRFGSRLLVTAVRGGKTTLYGIDCVGRRTVVARDAPPVEGGMAIAPSSFGRFGGDLIAPDEHSGRILAFSPTGAVRLVAESGVVAGGDIGVEGLGFVPSGFRGTGSAYFSDLGAPGSPTEGTDSLLALRGTELLSAGVRAGDLVAATEAGAITIVVHCARRCTVRRIGEGPAATHGEGHITFAPGRP